MKINIKIILIIFCVIMIGFENNTYSFPAINTNESLIDNLRNISQIDTFPVIYSEEYIEEHNSPEKFIVYRNYGKAILHSINKNVNIFCHE